LNDVETRAIAADLGVTAKEVTDMEQRLSSRDLSFDPAPDADEEDGAYSPSAYLQHPEADPSIAVEREQWDEDTTERLAQALETLDERSQHILRSRWMTDEKATLHELADRYGVSAERIRQIEANAIKKLRGIVAEPLEA
jgi:RNA polymerase sigma-32 factor